MSNLWLILSFLGIRVSANSFRLTGKLLFVVLNWANAAEQLNGSKEKYETTNYFKHMIELVNATRQQYCVPVYQCLINLSAKHLFYFLS